jgi:hypothetical protein
MARNEQGGIPRAATDAADPAGIEPQPGDHPLRQIRSALRGLRYGTVTAVVHDGVVVQVERTERVRLDQRGRIG